MVAELRLHNLRHLLRIGETEGHGSKGRVEDTTSGIAQLAAVTGGAGVFRVETGQCGKRRLALGDAVGIVAQLFLHAVNLLRLYARGLRDDLHLHLSGHEGQAVLRQVLEVAPHLSRRHLDILHKLLTHLLHHLAVAEVIMQLCTHLTDGLLLILLQLLA